MLLERQIIVGIEWLPQHSRHSFSGHHFLRPGSPGNRNKRSARISSNGSINGAATQSSTVHWGGTGMGVPVTTVLCRASRMCEG